MPKSISIYFSERTTTRWKSLNWFIISSEQNTFPLEPSLVQSWPFHSKCKGP